MPRLTRRIFSWASLDHSIEQESNSSSSRTCCGIESPDEGRALESSGDTERASDDSPSSKSNPGFFSECRKNISSQHQEALGKSTSDHPKRLYLLNSTDFNEFVITNSSPSGNTLGIPVDQYSEPVSRSFINNILSNCKNNTRKRYSDDIDEKPRHQITLNVRHRPVVFITGGGVYYFWKAGVVSYLSKHFDLTNCVFLGTSAGALTSVLACCNINITWASRLAIKFAMEESVWDRSSFLSGVLHDIAHKWLEYVLPKDIDMDRVRKGLVCTGYRLLRFRLEGLCNFASREDLVECLLASMHIPFYANGRAFMTVRGSHYVDGGFGGDILQIFGSRLNGNRVLVIRCSDDTENMKLTPRDYVQKLKPEEMINMMIQGYESARMQHSLGLLTALKDYEVFSPGWFDFRDDPYLRFEELMNPELDLPLADNDIGRSPLKI